MKLQNYVFLKKLFNKYWQLIVFILLLFSIFHLIRDILQILKIDNIISASLHTSRTWCNPVCDYVTIPPEAFIIMAAPIILFRKKFGILGDLILIVFFIWSCAFWYSYITR